MGNDPLKEYKYKEKLELKNPNSFPQVQKVDCPSCSETIPGAHLNIQTNIAKCNSCDIIFSISEQVENLSHQNDISQDILRPEGVELTHFQDDLDISVAQPWNLIEVILASIFPFLLLVGPPALIDKPPDSKFFLVGYLSFMLVSIIAYIAYFFIRKKHKVYIHIDDSDLHIEHRPKKFIKDKKYAIEDIDQVYIKSIMTSTGTKGVGIFMLVNDVKGQKKVELINSVNSRTKAKYIEQEIERHLGIKDRRVPDEEI